MPTSMPRAAAAGCGLAEVTRAQRTIISRAMQIRLNTKWFPPETRQQAPQPLLELDFRFPAQELPGFGDVGLANLWIVDWKCFEHDFALRRGKSDNCLREFQDRKLLRVAEVHRQMLAAGGKQLEPANEVVHVTEAARLRAVAEDRDRLVLERLAREGRDRAAVVGAHPGPVGVENPHDRGVHPLLAVVRHRQRLCVALRLVVDPARADRVDVAPVALRLRVHQRVAVDLARRREQEACALELGQPEGVVRAVRADLQRVQRLAEVVDRAGERRQVVDDVHGLVDLQVLDHVVVDEAEGIIAQVLEVLERAALEVVDADHAVARLKQVLTEMGAEKPGSPGDDSGWHEADMVAASPDAFRPAGQVLRTPYATQWVSSAGRRKGDPGVNLAVIDQPARLAARTDLLQVDDHQRVLDAFVVRLRNQDDVELRVVLVRVDDLGDQGLRDRDAQRRDRDVAGQPLPIGQTLPDVRRGELPGLVEVLAGHRREDEVAGGLALSARERDLLHDLRRDSILGAEGPFVFAVLPKYATRNAITPAASSAPAAHGSHLTTCGEERADRTLASTRNGDD